MLNILYFADPNTVHDIKWIEFFTKRELCKAYLICRPHQYKQYLETPGLIDQCKASNILVMKPVKYLSIKNWIATIKGVRYIDSVIRKNEIALIHVMYAEPNALWALFKFVFRIPMLLTTRGTDILYTIPNHFKKKDFLNKVVSSLYKNSFKNFDHISVTSETQQISVSKLGGNEVKADIIRTGIDLTKIREIISKEDFDLNLPDQRPFILFPRLMKPIYNHEFSIEVIKRLSMDLRTKYRMIFIGSDGEDRSYVDKIDKMLKEGDFEFTFYPKLKHDHILHLYKNASLVIMNPLSDGSPVSAMEAIALGQTVICGPIMYDSVFKGFIRQLSDWDHDEMAAIIEDALSPNQSKLAIDTFMKSIDQEVEMNRLLNIYQRLKR